MYTQRVARPRQLRRRHSVENQWDLLAVLGISPPDRVQFPVEMRADPSAAAAVGERLAGAGCDEADRLIVVHVSAGNPFRRWPLDHFVDLVTELADGVDDARVIVTSGPSDGDAASRVIDAARDRLADAGTRVLSCGEFSLDELRALVDRAALFIGGDSGPMHIASTSRVPIVGLYGPTLPVRSAPWRDQRNITISIDAGELPCRPCDQRVCAPGDFRCLTSIAADRVTAAAMHALGAENIARR